MNRTLLKMNIDAEKKLLLKCRRSLKGLPKGTLTCYTRNGRIYYKKYEDSKQKYLGTEENPLVRKLKRRHLLEKMIGILDQNIRLMENLNEGYKEYDPFVLQKDFSKTYQNVPADVISEMGYVFNQADSPKSDHSKIYKTSDGLLVRSRIEALIADLYSMKGIAFQYEPELCFSDGSRIRPDFKVFCPSMNKYKYHEHIGLLSDKNYFQGYLWKIEHYISNDLYPFYDVLFTYEKPDYMIDLDEISALIDLYMR